MALTIVVPANDQNATGVATFQVPAGKRLNLRYVTLQHGFVARIQIDTTVDGVTVTHNLINTSVIDHPIYLWADDTGPVTVRISQDTTNKAGETWPVSLTGELF